MPRWVLDTNVVLSALIRPGGVTGRLRLAWQSSLFVPLASRVTAAELVRVLAYPKFRLSAAEQHELLGDYLPWVEAVPLTGPAPPTPACRDPHDLPFLELALRADANAIVTGDADLLPIPAISGLRIVTPADAVARLSGATRPVASPDIA